MSEKKKAVLGISLGTAANRLRKALLFSMAHRLKEDFCFRCGCQIETVDEFSVEHKESWQLSDNPVEAYFDLKNISFSHLGCNSRAAFRVKVYANKKERDAAGWPRRAARRAAKGSSSTTVSATCS